MLRAGVIGLGVGEQHILGYRAAGVEVVALCDMSTDKRADAARLYPECKIYETAEELLDADDVDVVSIASYDHHHATQIVRAISRGKHVFSEKPICMNEDELDDIRNALKRNPRVRLSTNTILRMSERFRDIRRRVRAGELGRLYCVEADYNYGRLQKIMTGWRGEIVDYSVMLGGGIHMIDLLIWMVDSPVIEVSAVGNKLCSVGSYFQTPDMVMAWLRFYDGTIGKVGANFGCVYPHFHKIALYGTEGTFENGIGGGVLIRSRDPQAPPQSIKSAYPGMAKGDLIPGFIDTILGKGKAAVEELDVFKTMSACLAIDKSLRTGKPEVVETY
ncbi:MAG: Gfo/Idh/MocA family oxidoreductase [Rhodocyclaceae bacterium]|nr:Gfo/Idh/MocA family oxidoreductase [Rhodocyclaceae bacterium]MDZ4215551.1 Gfo/Idh/MocA family oxidoreductase [Rhodocyclaceae bacterium]